MSAYRHRHARSLGDNESSDDLLEAAKMRGDALMALSRHRRHTVVVITATMVLLLGAAAATFVMAQNPHYMRALAVESPVGCLAIGAVWTAVLMMTLLIARYSFAISSLAFAVQGYFAIGLLWQLSRLKEHPELLTSLGKAPLSAYDIQRITVASGLTLGMSVTGFVLVGFVSFFSRWNRLHSSSREQSTKRLHRARA